MKLQDENHFKKYIYHLLKHKKHYTANEQRQMVKDYNQTHNTAIRDELILSNLKLIYKLTLEHWNNNYKQNHMSLGDVFQEMILLFIQALKYYNPKFNLSTCFRTTVKTHIIKAVRMKTVKEPIQKQYMDTPKLTFTEYNEDIFEDEIESVTNYEDIKKIIKIAFKKLDKVELGRNREKIDEQSKNMIKMKYGMDPFEKEYSEVEIAKHYKITKQAVNVKIHRLLKQFKKMDVFKELLD